MDNKTVEEKIGLLDRALASAPDTTSLRVGIGLFTALMKSGAVADFATSPVPEPPTPLAMLAGLACIAALRLRAV